MSLGMALASASVASSFAYRLEIAAASPARPRAVLKCSELEPPYDSVVASLLARRSLNFGDATLNSSLHCAEVIVSIFCY